MNRIAIVVINPEGEIIANIEMPVCLDDTGGFWPSPNFNPIFEVECKGQEMEKVVEAWFAEERPLVKVALKLRKANMKDDDGEEQEA